MVVTRRSTGQRKRALLLLVAALLWGSAAVLRGQAAPGLADGRRLLGLAGRATKSVWQGSISPAGHDRNQGGRTGEPSSVRLPEGSRFDERLTRLFTPSRSPGFQYAVYVTGASLDACAEHFKKMDRARDGLTVGSKWQPRRAEPVAAFGGSGDYPRSRLARLFGGRPAFVARGSVRNQAGAFEASVTLLSPYPDAAFTRLETGTMIIVLTLERRG